VSHLDDGTLRRLIDEPAGGGADHAAECAACRDRVEALRAEAAPARAILAGPPDAVDVAAALRAVRARAAGTGGRRPLFLSPWAGALAALVVLGLLIAFTPLGTVAQGFLAIFEPHEFVAIPVTRSDLSELRALPNLDAYGTIHEGPRPMLATVADARAASLLAGVPVRVATYVPAGIPRPAQYHVRARSTTTFTFSAARATISASQTGKDLPPMPAGIDGSTLVASLGPVVVATYGVAPRGFGRLHARLRFHHGGPGLHGPLLVVAQAPAPRVSSSGASVRQIEDYLLALPGVPADLAAEIRAIGDPSTTLPIPVPVDREVAQPVTVQGVSGLGVLDDTGIGSGVVWQRDGIIYAVAGTLRAREILAVADSLR
jgi:hypothetical protein